MIDVGFVDESRMLQKQELGTWLHQDIARSARHAVGIDSDADGVTLARELGYEAYSADCENLDALAALPVEGADVVVAGELIEHLDQPARFLEAVKEIAAPTATLLITTPNACSLTNTLSSLLSRELVNPDHVSWYSWHTLQTLLTRHGWTIDRIFYYWFPKVALEDDAPAAERLRTFAFNTYQYLARPLFRLRPCLADGIIVVASLQRGQ